MVFYTLLLCWLTDLLVINWFAAAAVFNHLHHPHHLKYRHCTSPTLYRGLCSAFGSSCQQQFVPLPIWLPAHAHFICYQPSDHMLVPQCSSIVSISVPLPLPLPLLITTSPLNYLPTYLSPHPCLVHLSKVINTGLIISQRFCCCHWHVGTGPRLTAADTLWSKCHDSRSLFNLRQSSVYLQIKCLN